MNGKTLALLGVSIVFLTVSTIGTAGQVPKKGGVEPPPARKIPGISTEDPHPRACVSCHLDMPEIQKDVRIGTLMEKWADKVNPRVLAIAQACAPEGLTLTGVHPDVEASLADIPVSCFRCHDKMAKKAPPLTPMLHLIHLSGDGNEYLSLFQGECTYCHKLDTATGRWTMPSGPEKR